MRLAFLAVLVLGALPMAGYSQGTPADDDPSRAILTLDHGGHVGRINAMLFTRDGKRLITVGADKTIQIWDIQTRERLRVLRPPISSGNGGVLMAAALAPDDRTLAVAGYGFQNHPRDKLWTNHTFLINLDDGRIVRLLGPIVWTNAIAFSADGDQVAAGPPGRTFIWRGLRDIWSRKVDEQGLEPALEFTRPGFPNNPVGQLAFSPDGKRLAILHGNSALCQLWDLQAKPGAELIATLGTRTAAYGNASVAAWSPDGQHLAVGYTWSPPRPPLRLWSRDGKLEKEFAVKDLGDDYIKTTQFTWGSILSRGVFFRSDSEVLFCSLARDARGFYYAADLIDLEKKTGQAVQRVFGVAESRGLSAGFSPDGKRAALPSATGNGAVVFDLDGKPNPRPFGGGPVPYTVGWSKDGYKIAWSEKQPGRLSAALDLKEMARPTVKAEYRAALTERDGWKLRLTAYPSNSVIVERDGKEVCKTPNSGGGIFTYTLPPGGDLKWVAWSGQQGMYLSDIEKGTILRSMGFLSLHFPAMSFSADGKYLLASTEREYMALYYPNAKFAQEQSRPLLQIFVSGVDWVVWTHEGYYAATPGGERLMGWTVNNGTDKLATFYPADRFRAQLYRPDVIKRVLETGSVKEALKGADLARGTETRDVKLDDLLPPKAVLAVLDQSKLPTVKLKVTAVASAKNQPITSLRLMMDGRVVPGKETLVEFRDGKPKAEVEWTFEMPEGEHLLAVLARGPDSSSVSAPIRLKHIEVTRLPTLHVLTVGINNYQDGALDLKYAAPDAEALAAAFVTYCKGEPFQDVKTRTLLNQQATRGGILKELQSIRKATAQQDLVVVFFACHGVRQKKDYFLLTHEADIDHLDKSSLSGDDLRKTLAEFKCQVLLMLDACHSAGFGEGKKLSKLGLKPATDDVARDLTEDEYGVAVMCAAMSHEKAEGQGGHGLFTQAVLDALAKRPGVPFNRRNQRVYIHHLQSYVFDEVSIRSEERQHPFLSLPWVVESFVVR